MRRALAVLLCLLLMPSLASGEEASFIWTIRFGKSGVTTPYSITPAKGGGVFVAGATDAEDGVFGAELGGKDAFVVRLDASGTMLYSGRYGGSGDDQFTQVLETEDGGCLLLGTTTSADGDARAARAGMDGFLVRLNADGEMKWVKCLGGTLDDELFNVATADGKHFLVTGRSKSRNGDLQANYGGWDAFAALLSDDDNGKPDWVVHYGQAGDDQFIKAVPANGGWLILGEIAEEVSGGEDTVFHVRPVALMLSDAQEEIFQVALGSTGVNRLIDAQRTDTGFIFIGGTNSSSVLMPTPRGGLDIWLLQLRDSGSLAWQRTYGGSRDDVAYAVRQIPSGGIAMLGTTVSRDGQVHGSHGGGDLWLLLTSQSGGLVWQQALGGTGRETPAGFVLAADGGYLVAGTTTSQDGDIGPHPSTRMGFIAKLSANGNLLQTKTIGGSSECALHSIVSAEDGVYVLGSFISFGVDGPNEQLFLGKLHEE